MLLVLALLAQDPFADWTWRRPVTVTNRADHALPAGTPVQVPLDAASFRGKGEGADLVLSYDGARIAHLVERRDGRLVLRFRTPAGIGIGKSDKAFAIHYGNPAAPANPTKPSELFDFHEDFSGDGGSVAVDPALTASVDKGVLAITDVQAEKTEASPARIVLLKAAPAGAFALSVDFELAVKEGAQVVVGLLVDMKDETAPDEAVIRKVKAAIDALADPDFERREAATKDLIKLGKAALARVDEAARTGDAEVKWRAEHVASRIRADFPPRLVKATLRSDETATRATRSVAIGGRRLHYPASVVLPGAMNIRVERDADGDVTVLWNGVKRDEGEMKGEVKEISLVLSKGVAGPIGRVTVDNLWLDRHVPEDDRPAVTLEVEERRK
jgi:hypothetical protein